jgi:hypothetical protein
VRLGALVASAPIMDFQTCAVADRPDKPQFESIVCERNTVTHWLQQNNATTTFELLEPSRLVFYLNNIFIILSNCNGK